MPPVFGGDSGSVLFIISIPDVPPSLNVSRNLHWAAKARLRDKWILYVRSQMNDVPTWQPEKRHVKVVLHHSRPYDECDNMQGACKPLFDALKHWHLIHDDSPEWIGKPDISQAKCPHKQRHTVIEIGEAEQEEGRCL